MSASRPSALSRPALRLVGGEQSAPAGGSTAGGTASGTTGAYRSLPPVDLCNFDEVFRRYAPYVASIAMRLFGNESEVDDLVQDVFLEAHRGLSSLREPAAVGGWLARICVRRATRRLRRRRLLALVHLDVLSETELPLAAGASPEQRAEVTRLYQLLDRMPVDERVAWLLRHVEGESLDDMVALCGCSKSTVQRRLRAAEARIAQGVAT